MQRNEAALKQDNSCVSPLPSTSQSQPGSSTVSNSNAMEANADQSVVPSIEFLRSNESMQCEVEKQSYVHLMKQLPKVGSSPPMGVLGTFLLKNPWIGFKILY